MNKALTQLADTFIDCGREPSGELVGLMTELLGHSENEFRQMLAKRAQARDIDYLSSHRPNERPSN